MSGPPSREEFEAWKREERAHTELLIERVAGTMRLAVSELRGELATHQTEIRGDLRELQAKSAGKLTVWGSALTLFVGLAALTATLFAFGAQMFDVGAGRAEANSAIARETAQQVLTLQAAEELRESKARRGR